MESGRIERGVKKCWNLKWNKKPGEGERALRLAPAASPEWLFGAETTKAE
jgi:hypothetical protein